MMTIWLGIDYTIVAGKVCACQKIHGPSGLNKDFGTYPECTEETFHILKIKLASSIHKIILALSEKYLIRRRSDNSKETIIQRYDCCSY